MSMPLLADPAPTTGAQGGARRHNCMRCATVLPSACARVSPPAMMGRANNAHVASTYRNAIGWPLHWVCGRNDRLASNADCSNDRLASNDRWDPGHPADHLQPLMTS